MRLAFARAVLWFFGTIIFLVVFANEAVKNMSDQEQFVGVIAIGFVVGGAVFGYTWYGYERDERELRDKERRKKLRSEDGENAE